MKKHCFLLFSSRITRNDLLLLQTKPVIQTRQIVVYPVHSVPMDAKLEAYNNLLKFKGTLKRDVDYKSERNYYLRPFF